MKILQWCDNIFPAKGNMGAERVVERTCRGLQKLGHSVWLKAKPESKLDWIEVVQNIPKDCDIIHHHGWCWDHEEEYREWNKPWVSTIHGGGMEIDPNWLTRANNNSNIICVSKFVADRINCKAFVHACSDPSEFFFKEKKQDYFLYLSSLDWGFQKGLDIFVGLAKIVKNQKFVIAGGTHNHDLINWIKNICQKEKNITYVGEVNGKEKAELFANAKGYILPTQLPDACPTTISEALMSGTPVIGSINGSLPEIIHNSVGYICRNQSEYLKAILSIKKIDPLTCRQYAENNYSDVVTAQKYVMYYENMLRFGKV